MKLIYTALPYLAWSVTAEDAATTTAPDGTDPRSSFIEKGTVSNQCGDLKSHQKKIDFRDFPDIDNFPPRNYVVRYKTNEKRGVDSLLVFCRSLRKKAPVQDREAKKKWEKQAGKNKRGRFRCKKGRWVQQGTYPVPECPSIAKNSWHYHMNPHLRPATEEETTGVSGDGSNVSNTTVPPPPPTDTTTTQTTPQDSGVPVGYNRCGIRRPGPSRIVNGQQARQNEFPWQVGIRAYSGFGFCGGSIVNEEWILTAAHCVEYSDSIVGVAVGWHESQGDGDDMSPDMIAKGTAYIRVARQIRHPDYDPSSLRNDIALIQLAEKINFSAGEDANVRQACLPTPSADEAMTLAIGNNPKCIVSGFGKQQENDDTTEDYLAYIDTPIITNSQCRSKIGGIFEDNTQVCAQVTNAQNNNENADSCQGDSGGPLVCKKDGLASYLQMGVVSWGYACGSNNPAVYTRVSKFVDWINDTTGADDIQWLY